MTYAYCFDVRAFRIFSHFLHFSRFSRFSHFSRFSRFSRFRVFRVFAFFGFFAFPPVKPRHAKRFHSKVPRRLDLPGPEGACKVEKLGGLAPRPRAGRHVFRLSVQGSTLNKVKGSGSRA